tara:strand:- start:167 stop:427 length:261 start_codon:yes stop_codon:yes gene_type:complete
MKYYFKSENRIITTEELTRKYGALGAIPQLGIYDLSVQPSYEPVAYTDLGNETYHPVESYEEMKSRAMGALLNRGFTQHQAASILA